MKVQYVMGNIAAMIVVLTDVFLFSIASGQSSHQCVSSDSVVVDKIAFYSGRFGHDEICLVNSDGTGFQRLTNNEADDECPSFSPDGSKIAFISNRDGNFEIYVMNPDGTDQQRLTNSPEDEIHTDWSPNGTKIAFSRYADQSHANIFVMNIDGSNVRQITDHPGVNMRPDWFPDGTQILFNSNRDGNYEIYRMNADGSDQQRMSNTAAFEVFPQLSPDGSKIIYARIILNPFYGAIHLRNLDGSMDTALTQNSRSEDPVWSPDGKYIAFHSSRSGNFEVYSMNADGSNQQQLTNHPDWDGWPSWGRVRVATHGGNHSTKLPSGLNLHYSFPNPFNLSTTIRFDVPSQIHIRLEVFNVLGNGVKTLLDEVKNAGSYSIRWNGIDGSNRCVSSGIYICKLSSDAGFVTQKIMLLK